MPRRRCPRYVRARGLPSADPRGQPRTPSAQHAPDLPRSEGGPLLGTRCIRRPGLSDGIPEHRAPYNPRAGSPMQISQPSRLAGDPGAIRIGRPSIAGRHREQPVTVLPDASFYSRPLRTRCHNSQWGGRPALIPQITPASAAGQVCQLTDLGGGPSRGQMPDFGIPWSSRRHQVNGCDRVIGTHSLRHEHSQVA